MSQEILPCPQSWTKVIKQVGGIIRVPRSCVCVVESHQCSYSSSLSWTWLDVDCSAYIQSRNVSFIWFLCWDLVSVSVESYKERPWFQYGLVQLTWWTACVSVSFSFTCRNLKLLFLWTNCIVPFSWWPFVFPLGFCLLLLRLFGEGCCLRHLLCLVVELRWFIQKHLPSFPFDVSPSLIMCLMSF